MTATRAMQLVTVGLAAAGGVIAVKQMRGQSDDAPVVIKRHFVSVEAGVTNEVVTVQHGDGRQEKVKRVKL